MERPDPTDVVAIDGPAGSGKSTVARRVARRLGWRYVDTGAMYRVLCLVALEEGIPMDDATRLVDRLEGLELTMKLQGGDHRVLADGRDVTEAIRDPEISDRVSRMATLPPVRSAMVERQRRMGERSRSVVEGRDIGTVVFPDARYKFYLDASLEERARRRFEQLRERGRGGADLQEVLREMGRRDERDSTRSSAPLRAAADARRVNTTDLSVEQVVQCLLETIEST